MRRREGKRKRAFLIWGLCPQTPEIYRFGARMTRGTIGALERRIGLRQRCDPSADSRAGMAGAASAAPNINSRLRLILTYCGRKMVRTLGATFFPCFAGRTREA